MPMPNAETEASPVVTVELATLARTNAIRTPINAKRHPKTQHSASMKKMFTSLTVAVLKRMLKNVPTDAVLSQINAILLRLVLRFVVMPIANAESITVVTAEPATPAKAVVMPAGNAKPLATRQAHATAVTSIGTIPATSAKTLRKTANRAKPVAPQAVPPQPPTRQNSVTLWMGICTGTIPAEPKRKSQNHVITDAPVPPATRHPSTPALPPAPEKYAEPAVSRAAIVEPANPAKPAIPAGNVR